MTDDIFEFHWKNSIQRHLLSVSTRPPLTTLHLDLSHRSPQVLRFSPLLSSASARLRRFSALPFRPRARTTYNARSVDREGAARRSALP